MRTTARLLAAGLFVAGALALPATQTGAQGKSDGGQKGATGGPPQSRTPSRGKASPPLPEAREAAPDAAPSTAEVPEGGDDEAAGARHTCPDRGNKLELII
jgi:hypothetical protein